MAIRFKQTLKTDEAPSIATSSLVHAGREGAYTAHQRLTRTLAEQPREIIECAMAMGILDSHESVLAAKEALHNSIGRVRAVSSTTPILRARAAK